MSIDRVRVKICGVTNRADAEAAIACGADALGFNLYAGSKRCIDLRTEAEWIRDLPPFVARVAVMVDPSIAEAETVFAEPGIDAVQFHGNESEEFCARFAERGLPFIKAIAARDAASLDLPLRFHTRRILLDAYAAGAFGGTGKLIDLALAQSFAEQNPAVQLVLSGGLTSENVAEAVRRVRPYAVDVASGVEREPRRKDVALMKCFIAAAKRAHDTQS